MNGAKTATPSRADLERRILELERTTHLLEEARSHFADQYDFAPFGCLTLDAMGCVLELNVTAARMLGRERAQIQRMPLLPYVSRDHMGAFVHHLRECKRQTAKVRSEILLRPRRGKSVLVEMVSVPVHDQDTEGVVYRTALLDIGRRRLAEIELNRLRSAVLEIGDRERATIGEDLHDGVCQDLTGIAYLTDTIVRSIESDAPKTETAEKVREVSTLIRETIEEARRLAAGLFPVKLERFGLPWALGNLAEETCERSEAFCRFEMPRPISFTDPNVSIHLYRIAQEAVRNAIRHGQARKIVLKLSGERDMINLSIRDDGNGLPPPQKRSGIGLDTMHYRAQMLGGALEVKSESGKGTSVSCTFPDRGVVYVHESTHNKEADFSP